jgi:hypothetical protein
MDDAFQEDEAAVTSFSWFKQLLGAPKSISDNPESSQENNVLSIAKAALPQCHNLREVSIVIYDHLIPENFRDFLRHLWKTMGVGIQKLTLATTINKVPDLFGLIAKHAPQLTNLESLDLTVVGSRFPREKRTVEDALNAIVTLVHRFKGSLTHFVFSSATEFDHASLFTKLGLLPKLQKLELWFAFHHNTTLTDQGRSVGEFLVTNSETLENLVLKTHPRFECFFFSSQHDMFHRWVVHQLPKLVLPRVHVLDLGLRQITWNPYDTASLNRIPLLPPILPRLRTLILSEESLSFRGLGHILGQTEGKLEALECRVWTFTPGVLALLVSKAPHLRTLTLGYLSTGAQDADVHGTSTHPASSGSISGVPDDVYTRIQAARYPEWTLSHLRLGQRIDSCGEIHPNDYLMKLVKEAVCKEVSVDVDMKCDCRGSFWSKLGY